jgi:hypothetical protein
VGVGESECWWSTGVTCRMMAGNELRDLVDWERTIGAPKLTSEMTHKMSELRHVLAAAHKGSPHWVR